jgi:ubiquinone/menaquinone biosynthesis C-methylase UbiE
MVEMLKLWPRLAKQYAMKKSLYGWSTAVPDSIDVTRLENVIDIAAGTCVWTLDLASMPQIRSLGDKIHIYACDINPGFIPAAQITDELGIKTFVQDATKPFPAEYHGAFDLIHASFLALCLTEEGWYSALANFNTLLSP